jgi:hypothetical protein
MHRQIECRYENKLIASMTFLENKDLPQMMVLFDRFITSVREVDGKKYYTTMPTGPESRVENSYRHLSKREIISQDQNILEQYLSKYFPQVELYDISTSYTTVDFKYKLHNKSQLLGYLLIKENYFEQTIELIVYPINAAVMPYDFNLYNYKLSHELIMEDYINRMLPHFHRSDLVISANF